MVANTRVPQTGTGVDVIQQLAQLLGGTRTNTNSNANLGPLQQVLGQLQGTDYSQLLQGVFQQAAGNIPGLRNQMANAAGLRTGNNGGLDAALQQLLMQTTLAGTQQLTEAQLRNQQLQVQGGGAVAQATRSTQEQTGTNLGRAIQAMTLAQALSKSGILPKAARAFGDFTDGFSNSGATDIMSPGVDTSGALDVIPGTNSMGGGLDSFGYDLGTMPFTDSLADAGSYASDFGNTLGNYYDSAASTVGGWADSLGQWWDSFADGGMVGRDGNKPMANYADGGLVDLARPVSGWQVEILPPGMTAEDLAKRERDRAPAPQQPQMDFKARPLPNAKPRDKDKKAPNQPKYLADGGMVTQRAPGTRQSSAPQFVLPMMETSQVSQGRRTGGVGNDGSDPGSGVGVSGPGNISAGRALANVAMGLMGPIGLVASIMDQAINQQNPEATGPFGAINSAVNGNLIGLVNAVSNISNAAGRGGSAANSGGSGFGGMDGESGNVDGGGRSSGTGAASSGVGIGGVGGGGGMGGGGFGSSSGGGYGADGMRSGGPVDGPGTGTSDSIPAMLSDGEYVIPADVVNLIGVEFFDTLKNAFHKPVGGKE